MNENQVDVEPGGEAGPSGKTPKTLGQRLKELVRENLLILLLVVSLVLGIILGFLLRIRPEPYTKREIMNLRFPGEILVNMLKILILPLIVSSLIVGLTSLDVKSTGKLGLRAVVYYFTTTFLAVILGIILVVSIKPGDQGDKPHQRSATVRDVKISDTLMDLVRQLFPNNMIEVAFQKTLTKLKNTTRKNNGVTKWEMTPYLTSVKGMNMLGLVAMSIATSIAINVMGPKGDLLKACFHSLMELTLVIINWVIWYSPLGILFLVVKEIVAMDDPVLMFKDLGYYVITVLLGLAIHGFVVLPALYLAVCRSNPYRFLQGILQAVVTAFGTASSLATLPVTMQNLEENNHIDPRVVGFVAPVGATINMDGTALYEAVAVIFIAQAEGKELGIAHILVICLTATVAAIGAAGVPQAGLVTMVIVLSATGLSSDKIGLILSVDWLLDRFRTAINVMGDAFGCGIVQQLCRVDLHLMTQEEQTAAAGSGESPTVAGHQAGNMSQLVEATEPIAVPQPPPAAAADAGVADTAPVAGEGSASRPGSIVM